MINTKNSGYIVQVTEDRLGRTFHKNGLINGKIPVYLCTKYGTLPETGDKVPLVFSNQGTLFKPEDVKHIGFID